MAEWKKVFPEIEWIKDTGLAEQVTAVWEDALKRGGWSEADLPGIPFTLLVDAGGVSLVEHTRIVTAVARSAASVMSSQGEIDIDHDQLIAGALLHDVGKLLEYRKRDGRIEVSRSGKLLRHPLSGAGLAARHDLPEEVCHMIAVHSREGEKSYRSPEAVIVHHADFIAFETVKAVQAAPTND